MLAKNIRNLIISLFVIIIGIKLILNVAAGYISQVKVVPVEIPPLEGIANLFILALVLVMLVLVPFYLSKRSKERREQLNKLTK